MANVIQFLVLTSFLILPNAKAADPKILIYDVDSVMEYNPRNPMGAIIASRQMAANPPKKIDPNVFEKTIKSAIKTFENSMRDTCTREMKTSISVTAEGNWAVVGVSITGSMDLNILNPAMSKNCGVEKITIK